VLVRGARGKILELVRRSQAVDGLGNTQSESVRGVPGGAEIGSRNPKPVEAMRRPILNNTRLKDIVYDPFLGSGTTLIAADLTDRVCHGLEIDPHYVDVIVTRWQDLTGKKAVLDADGRTFEQVAEERKQIMEVETCPAQN
jgi:DNA modification methylase